MELNGNLVDVTNKKIFPASIKIEKGKIAGIKKSGEKFNCFLLPGLIDSHVHVESAMLAPSMFAELAARHGTTAIVTDPHEIGNVLGVEGIEFMIKDSKQSPVKIFFTAPSCVPATPFETSGAVLDSKEIEKLMQLPEIVALGEMMNFPGVVNHDKEVMKKIGSAKRFHKPIDGHCPGLKGDDLKKYIAAGITTDHECVTLDEAREKMELGMKIMIREGSSAKNMNELISLAKTDSENCFLVSDDLHCGDLMKGHINLLLRKAISLGVNVFDAVRMVTLNPARHYNLQSGLLRVGDSADIAVVDNLKDFNVLETWISGKLVAKNGKTSFRVKRIKGKNTFNLRKKQPKDFEIKTDRRGSTEVNVIEVVRNQIVTRKSVAKLSVKDGKILPDTKRDILKICVAERYGKNNLSVAFVHGFNLKSGAIASSVAHDSHNIIAVGTSDENIARAVNVVREMRGGLVAVDKDIVKVGLPIAGLMSNEDPEQLNKKLEKLFDYATKMCGFNPFPVISFLALLVIPELKISDRGLFDVNEFSFTNLEVSP
jgi:adenine deaminase